ncbi:hypothetical protein GNI_155880 [Gregarina niphandrodes]|uniref:Transmembrane protein n=1 Tax=Gregarina niphandrodes TaxID=110365 RepID=A0A023AZL9_GRENI|nr:hypothetical protein GNI_155880 [Gregarina niphandrodes]EZG43946.1 hypothetical protein GNI_155880 [Gregarina niphandrodes]|eukprot:XP_011132917.1 hypothetical protein GNI_155880 [Gregarina niphandrodes]
MFTFLVLASTVAFAQTSVDCVAYYTLNQASLVDPSQIQYCVAQCNEMPTAGTCPEGSPVTDCVQSLDACKFVQGGEAVDNGEAAESAPTESGEAGEAVEGGEVAPSEAVEGGEVAPSEGVEGGEVAPSEGVEGGDVVPSEAVEGGESAPVEASDAVEGDDVEGGNTDWEVVEGTDEEVGGDDDAPIMPKTSGEALRILTGSVVALRLMMML